MTAFNLDDVRRIMRECAGEDGTVTLDGDIADTPFTELGYDSLAVLELAARIQQQMGIPMPDEALDHLQSPGSTVEYVNNRAAAAGIGG
jgi:minimal PKS acyl carrier protein